MNILNINSTTYSEIEKELGILTDDGLNELIEQLEDIAHDRENAGMVEYKGLLKITKLIDSLKIERKANLNILTISDYEEINKVVFDNRSSKEKIKVWILRGMLTDLAELIDEGFRYGLGDSNETKLLNDFLFYLTTLYIQIEKD